MIGVCRLSPFLLLPAEDGIRAFHVTGVQTCALPIYPDVGGTDRHLVQVTRIERLGDMEVYDIQTESGEYLSGSVRVHNCFILAVDDTMDAILDWYREEGLIFKGGSGAGVNLSRIRSSKELLSSGGTA